MIKKNILAFIVLFMWGFALQAKVVPAPVFADGMVLQQQTEAALWGIAKPNSKVVITTTWSKSKTVVNSDADPALPVQALRRQGETGCTYGSSRD